MTPKTSRRKLYEHWLSFQKSLDLIEYASLSPAHFIIASRELKKTHAHTKHLYKELAIKLCLFIRQDKYTSEEQYGKVLYKLRHNKQLFSSTLPKKKARLIKLPLSLFNMQGYPWFFSTAIGHFIALIIFKIFPFLLKKTNPQYTHLTELYDALLDAQNYVITILETPQEELKRLR